MSRELQLLAADCRQALFDAVKTDEGAGTNLRFEVGRAVGLLGRLSDALPTDAPSTHCAMGVGCDEAGQCYADANGEPDRCPKKPHTSATQP